MKFSGKVGFYSGTSETKPGIWTPAIIERTYTGDIIRNNRRFQNSEHQNDTLTTNNSISILSDLYARQNWQTIRYVIWNDVKLKVTSVEINYPKLVLEIGGVYNG